MSATVNHYDDRAAVEADLKGDKYGLGLGVLRKRKLAAQRVLLLLEQLAHNVLLWARTWLAAHVPRRSESTRLNSSHANISYAVFCLKKQDARISRLRA